MILKCLDGPMDGAVYTLSREFPSTNRKPDGLWFDGQDEHGRNVQNQYAYDRLAAPGDHVTLCYRFTGQVVDSAYGQVVASIVALDAAGVEYPSHEKIKLERETRAQLESNVAKLHGQLAECREELGKRMAWRLTESVRSLKAQLAAANETIRDLEAEVEIRRERKVLCAEQEKRIAELEEQLKSADETWPAKERAIKHWQERADTLWHTIRTTANERIAELERWQRDRDADCTLAVKRIAELELTLRDREEEVVARNGRIAELEERCAALESVLRRYLERRPPAVARTGEAHPLVQHAIDAADQLDAEARKLLEAK